VRKRPIFFRSVKRSFWDAVAVMGVLIIALLAAACATTGASWWWITPGVVILAYSLWRLWVLRRGVRHLIR